MGRRRIATSLALTGFVVLTAVTAGNAASKVRHAPARATKTVNGVVTHWSPTTVRISEGDMIKWDAVSGSHTVSAYGGRWAFNRQLPNGTVRSRIFRDAGTFRFRCMIHSTLTNGICSGMCGKVVVRG
jgi:plastocyanin